MAALIEDITQPLDVSRLGSAGVAFRGELALTRFPRLSAELADARGRVRIELHAAQQDHGPRTLGGTLQTELSLTCQRCLNPLRLPLRTTFRLALIETEEEADAVPAGTEAIALQSAQVNVLELLEDELLLCLPIAPRHRNDEHCVAPARRQNSTFNKSDIEERVSPFAVLRDLPVKQSPEKL